MRTFLAAILTCYLLIGCAAPIPLDAPISLDPRGTVEREIQIPTDEKYVVDLVFEREGIPFEKLRELIGAGHVCHIEAPCPKGVAVSVRWSIRRINDDKIVASGEIDSFDSTGWSKAEVYRQIGSFKVNRGSYVFKTEVLHDVPELASIKTRVMIYHHFK